MFKFDLSKINRFLMNSVIGAIIVGIITSAIYDVGKDKFSDKNVSQEAIVVLDKVIEPYKEEIKELEKRLQKSLPPEKRRELENRLKELKRELDIKNKEVQALKKMLQNFNSDIVKEAKSIFAKEGIDKALAYLKSKDIEKRGVILKQQMKDFAQKYILQAQLLKIKNRYKEAKVT